MAHCPSCGASIEQDFGMVTCAQCHAVLMVNINGDVVMGSEDPVDAANDWESQQDNESHHAEEAESWENESEPMPMESGWDQDDEGGGGDFSHEDPSESWGGSDSMEAPDKPVYEAAAEESQSDMDDDTFEDVADGFEPIASPSSVETMAESFDNHETSTEFDESESSYQSEVFNDGSMAEGEADLENPSFEGPEEPDPEPVDITDFANSEASSLEQGEYLYQLKVSGLDSKDLRDTLKAVLMDDKLKLNHLAILKQVKQGRVQINDLNPVKAKRIVEQLQFFDIQVRWRQVRVVMAEGSETELEEAASEGEVEHDL